MRSLQTLLELLTFSLLVILAVMQFRVTNFDLSEREQQDDKRLRDYVISYDLEYVKQELITLQKERWDAYEAHARHTRNTFVLVFLAALTFVFSRMIAVKRRMMG